MSIISVCSDRNADNTQTILRSYPRPVIRERRGKRTGREPSGVSKVSDSDSPILGCSRARTPPKTPFTFVDRDRRARIRERGEIFNVIVSRTREVRYRRTRRSSDLSDNSIHRLGKIEELRHLLRLPTSPPDLHQPPFPLSLSPPERYNHVRCHRRRHRSEKEVNACERVPLGKELGQEPMVRSARWSDRF